MKRILLAGSCLALALWLGGCSTVTGDFHQKLQIDAVDAQNRAVDGMQCRVGTATATNPITVTTPATGVRVRRSNEPLLIECKRDNLVAQATVKSRRERMEEALLPFGSVGVFVDHLSGALYAYPTALHLHVGQHIVLEHGGEAQIAQADPIVGAPSTPPAPAGQQQQRVVTAAAVVARTPAARTAPLASTAKTASKAKPAAKPSSARAAAPAKPARRTAVASAQTKPADPRTAVASAQTAPVNW